MGFFHDRKFIFWVGGLVIILPLGLLIFIASPHKFFPTYKIYHLFEHPLLIDLGDNIAQSRNSLMKIANIVHFPYWFKKSSLPVFSLGVALENLIQMEEELPEKKFFSSFTEENKKFVKAQFNTEGYEAEVEIRYRGANPIHWNNSKRSLLIRFPKDHLFQGMRSVDLIIPEDRVYAAEQLNSERIKGEGLAHRRTFFARLNVNNKDAGVYFAAERFSEEWLELAEFTTTSEVFSQGGQVKWGGWKKEIHEKDASYEALETLLSFFEFDDDEVSAYDSLNLKLLAQIIDLPKWYSALAVNVLAGSVHSSFGNLNLLWNNITGKFEPLLEDVVFASVQRIPGDTIYEVLGKTLYRPILSSPSLYREYRKKLAKMASNENSEKDLAYYNTLSEILIPELYKDQTKARGDLYVKNEIEEIRSYIEENYKRAQSLAGIEEPPIRGNAPKETRNIPLLPGSFLYLAETILSPSEWRRNHPEFMIKNGEIILPVGSYVFRKNVIIPSGTRLTISAGVKIYFDKGISLVSYSPIRAIGTKQKPITIGRAQPGKHWGAFALINVDEPSEFRYVTMVGGSSSEKINGVTFSGMLSAHNAPIKVYNSQFYEDLDDDAIHVAYSSGEIAGSRFSDTAGDAIDLDFAPDFILKNNTFTNIGTGTEGGDAIDLSFTTAQIENNTIKKCADKGISVGERSTPEIRENFIEGCAIGIAIKDQSVAVLRNNTLSKNQEAISLYQKKPVFGGAKAIEEGNILQENRVDYNVSENSEIIRK